MTDTLLTLMLIFGGLWLFVAAVGVVLVVYAMVETIRRSRNDKD